MDLNDDPPTYEPPPSYEEVMTKEKDKMQMQCGRFVGRVTTVKLPDSPPPPYKDDLKAVVDSPFSDNEDGAGPSNTQPLNTKPLDQLQSSTRRLFNIRSLVGWRDECDCAGACSCAVLHRISLSAEWSPTSRLPATWSPATTKLGALDNLLQSIHSTRNGCLSSNTSNIKGSISAHNILQSESEIFMSRET